jgi:tetratricopeptide (TPR) repeat protein
LLCRMGCYRYQDVKTVPFEGLICLLWDVPESRQVWVVDYLSKTSLIEVKGEYYLHPAIRDASQSILFNEPNNKKEANLKAAEFLKSVTSKVKTVEDAILGFEVIYHYLEANDYAKAASVIFEIEGNGEDDLDNFGYSCWRLGFSHQISTTVSTICQVKNVISDVNILAGLYRIAGYAQNQLGNIHTAINHHNYSGQITYRYLDTFVFDKNDSFHFKISDMVRNHFFLLSHRDFNCYAHEMNSVDNISLLPTSTGIYGNEPIVDMMCAYFINSGLCYMDLWEIDKSIEYLEKGMLVASISENRYWVEGNCCLSLAKSISGSLTDAYKIAEEADINYTCRPMTAWGRAYSPLLLAKTYKNLGNIEKSFDLYSFAFSIAEKNKYTQAKANTMIGLAEIHRESKKLELACSQNLEAVKLLIYIGAKCDLAEAYFQLGLTYQAMGEQDLTKAYKAKALELFTQMEAPKQIDRANKAFEQGAMK